MPAGSSVVNVGSSAALTAHYPVAYTTSKWALRGLSHTAALELGPRGIRVDTVHPGYIEAEMTASAAPVFRAANIRETPLGRTGTPGDVVNAAVFLASDEASYVTGADLVVDGGWSAVLPGTILWKETPALLPRDRNSAEKAAVTAVEAPRGRHHHRVRHPRPGRGDVPVGPHRRVRARPPPAGRHAHRDLRDSRHSRSRRHHRSALRNPAASMAATA